MMLTELLRTTSKFEIWVSSMASPPKASTKFEAIAGALHATKMRTTIISMMATLCSWKRQEMVMSRLFCGKLSLIFLFFLPLYLHVPTQWGFEGDTPNLLTNAPPEKNIFSFHLPCRSLDFLSNGRHDFYFYVRSGRWHFQGTNLCIS